jgi:hypothetical protein
VEEFVGEDALVVTSEQMEKLIQWLRENQKPQTIDEMTVQYIRILKDEQTGE